jgi:hypothetical protein
MAATDEQAKAYIAALLEEKRMHPERAKEIDAELTRMGHNAAPPAKRAATRDAEPPKRRGRPPKVRTPEPEAKPDPVPVVDVPKPGGLTTSSGFLTGGKTH